MNLRALWTLKRTPFFFQKGTHLAPGISRPKQSRRRQRCGRLLAQTNTASAAHRPSPMLDRPGVIWACDSTGRSPDVRSRELRTHFLSLASVPIPSRLLRSSDAGDEAKRHHGHLIAVMDVADVENSVDRMFAGLGRPKRDGEDKYAPLQCLPAPSPVRRRCRRPPPKA